ncbi:MAG: hypothetical protein ABWY12_00205 [Burkholderiales bacterium]
MDSSREQPASARRPSLVLALAFAIVFLDFWVWNQTSSIAYLVSAAAFAALAASFCFSPISLRKSFTENAEAIRSVRQPSWVTGSGIFVLVLLFIGLAMRWSS